MPIVIPPSGPEQVLLRIRHTTPLHRRTPAFRWSGVRWWQYAAGFALTAGVIFWSRSEDSSHLSTVANSPSSVNFSSVPLRTATLRTPTVKFIDASYAFPDAIHTSRPSSTLLFRHNPINPTEPYLIPSVVYPTDPLLGYQPVSNWNTIPVEPEPSGCAR
ncbi:MAG: hypothetical protein NZ556_02595 [Fimbriimonadales bacterium]|nr:hypothetical protein [Fimbriimonadales bacterium]